MNSFEIRAEMTAQLQRIDNMTAEECLHYMSSLYDHELDANSPLCDLRTEAKSQCRRDYDNVLTDSEKADFRWVDALVATAKGKP